MDCNGCTKCCRWNGNKELMPKGLKMDKDGNCTWLVEGGCVIYDNPKRPGVCKKFTCVDMVEELEDDCFMAVLMEGLRRTDEEKE